MSKYQILVNILDQLRKEAPPTYKSYHPLETEIEKLNNARSRAFIHLYLKVKFGVLSFIDREDCITDGPQDGGIDAYYISEENKVIYFIQAKFRTTEDNFQDKDIEPQELLSMEVNRIVKGETCDETGNSYNKKVQALIRKLPEILDIARYDYQVVILANVTKLKPAHLRKLVLGFPCTVFDFNRCYEELVFPVVSGTFFQTSDWPISINLANKDFSSSRISYPVQTKSVECDITVLFVPTIEIAKNFHKFKNAILKYNPRSYLGLSRNPVNREIARTIREQATNEFALFNNGITVISDETKINLTIGQRDRGQLYLMNPQIINGGQTAYTLSQVYEDALASGENAEKIFGTKEVMLKVITVPNRDGLNEAAVLDLIADISRATNSQTSVQEADRRANDRIHIGLQHKIFSEFGYFYERKRGEFFDGLRTGYISREKIIDRQDFIRACYASMGKPAEASRTGQNALFRRQRFNSILGNLDQLPRMFFSFLCYKKLTEIRSVLQKERSNRFGILNYGNALEHGILAAVSVSHFFLTEEIKPSNIESLVDGIVPMVLSKWLAFEDFVKSKNHNTDYFRKTQDPDSGIELLEADFSRYYRGRTLNNDLASFFNLEL